MVAARWVFLNSPETKFADLPGTLHLSRYCAPVADNKAEVEAVRHLFQDIQTREFVQIGAK
jgi:hypothetical protein